MEKTNRRPSKTNETEIKRTVENELLVGLGQVCTYRLDVPFFNNPIERVLLGAHVVVLNQQRKVHRVSSRFHCVSMKEWSKPGSDFTLDAILQKISLIHSQKILATLKMRLPEFDNYLSG
uniref:Uncharacterized protein n=1 Tax=Ditylenchus dipsaci TaxID=166011 RepID=A0A915CRC8_9BILA